MKKTSRILVYVVLGIMMFSLCACMPNAGKVERDKIQVWTTSNTEKVLQDKEYKQKGNMELKVSMFRNEDEGAQLFITPSVDIANYTVLVSDLVNVNDPTKKITKDNVFVFHQKYISVERSSANILPLGMYPDALLPYETAVEYRENQVKANENQGIYFRFKTTADMPGGLYKGTYQLSVASNVFEVPVTVEVYDYVLEDEVHTKTSFGIHRYWGEGGIVTAEKDASWEMYAAYYEYLLENRISSRYLPAAMGDIDGFISMLKKYSKNSNFSNYIIPYVEKHDESDINGLKVGIDYELYEKYLWAIAEASVAEGRNLFEKASTYFAMFDEAKTAKQIATANHILTKVYALQEAVVNDMRNTLECENAALKASIVNGLLNINQLFVTSYQESFTAGATYCPDIRQYSQATSREKYDIEYVYNESTENEYKQNVDKWWYGFLVPTTPMPTYHIDDYLYSSRIMSWMQYNYDIVGNLYWSTTFFLQTNKGVNTPIQDYYDTALRFIGNVNDGSNGDGFLLYPGNPYGIYGPVGSLRIEGIRDGMEEYDLLYQLERAYEEVAAASGEQLEFDNVLSLLYQKLYSGTIVNTTSQTFEKVRRELAQLLMLSKHTGVTLLDSNFVGDSIELKVYVPSGKTITSSADMTGGGSVKTIRVPMANASNNVTITCGDYSLNLLLGGVVSTLSEKTLESSVTVSDGSKISIVSGEEIGFDGNLLKLNLAATDKLQSFSLVSSYIAQMGTLSDRIVFDLYNESGKDVRMQLSIVNNDGLSTPVSYVNLKSGHNEVIFNVSAIGWGAIGGVSKLKFDIGARGDNVSRELYINTVTFISKSE